MIGGAGIVVESLYRNLKSLSGYEIDVFIVGLRASVNTFKENKTVKTLGLPRLRRLNAIFISRVKLSNYDLVVGCDHLAVVLLSLVKEKISKLLVLTHGDELEEALNYRSNIKKIIGYRRRYLLMCSIADRVVYPSKFLKGKLAHHIHTAKQSIAFVGVDESKLVRLRKPIAIESDSLRFISVGRLVKGKGYLETLRFLEQLANKGFDVTWSIVGDGEFRNEFKEIVNKSSLKDGVLFRGYLSGMELSTAYNKANIFIQLSEMEESFGLVYVEAGLAGLILIGRPLGAVKERINELNGLHYESLEQALRFFIEGTWRSIQKEDIISKAEKDSKDTLTELICVE